MPNVCPPPKCCVQDEATQHHLTTDDELEGAARDLLSVAPPTYTMMVTHTARGPAGSHEVRGAWVIMGLCVPAARTSFHCFACILSSKCALPLVPQSHGSPLMALHSHRSSGVTSGRWTRAASESRAPSTHQTSAAQSEWGWVVPSSLASHCAAAHDPNLVIASVMYV